MLNWSWRRVDNDVKDIGVTSAWKYIVKYSGVKWGGGGAGGHRRVCYKIAGRARQGQL